MLEIDVPKCSLGEHPAHIWGLEEDSDIPAVADDRVDVADEGTDRPDMLKRVAANDEIGRNAYVGGPAMK